MIQLGRVLTDTTLNPPIKALHVWNSNPAVIAADQQKVLDGLRREDLFTVVHDQFLTDTARYAAIEPVGESKSNAEVARLLAARLGFARVGPPVGQEMPADFSFAFSSEGLASSGLDPVAEYRPPANVPIAGGAFPLRLLTLKRHHSINSSYTALPVYLGAEPDAHCEIHPDDAGRRGIRDGYPLRVVNEIGVMECVASVTEKVMVGTVAVPFGRGQGRSGAAVANSLTSESAFLK